MRINEVLTESQQLDELSLSGVGKAVGGLAKGVGGAVGAIGGVGQEFVSGVRSGNALVRGRPNPVSSRSSGSGGSRIPPTSSSSGTPQPGTPPNQPPASQQQLAQLNQAVSSLNLRDLKKLQSTVNALVQAKAIPPRSSNPGSTPPNPNPNPGPTPPAPRRTRTRTPPAPNP